VWIVKTNHAAARRFGLVHGGVRPSQELFTGLSGTVEQGYTDTCCTSILIAVQVYRFGHEFEQLFSKTLGVLCRLFFICSYISDDDDKFVAAETSNGIKSPKACREGVGQDLEQLITKKNDPGYR